MIEISGSVILPANISPTESTSKITTGGDIASSNIVQRITNSTSGPNITKSSKGPIPNPSSQLNATSNFKTYQNSTYGITSVQYPSDWTINETNSRPNSSSVVDIVTFYPPVNSYSSGEHTPYVLVSIDNPNNSQSTMSLSSYLQYTINSYSQGHPDYTTINSNTTAKLGGFPAYSLEFSDSNYRLQGILYLNNDSVDMKDAKN